MPKEQIIYIKLRIKLFFENVITLFITSLMDTVLIHPGIDEGTELEEQVKRIKHFTDGKVKIVYFSASMKQYVIFDKEPAQLPAGILCKFRLILSACILYWKVDPKKNNKIKFSRLLKFKFVNGDRFSNRVDGWDIVSLAYLNTSYQYDYLNNKEKLIASLERIGIKNNHKVYIFGTGPSLEKANQHKFTDGSVIVCNTIVKDPDIIMHLQPDYIVAADAIYHYGYSDYAQAFMNDLRKRLLEYANLYFVYPKTFDQIVRIKLKEVYNRCIAIPQTSPYPNFDLKQYFWLPSYENILPQILIPLAATVSKDIYFWGFDGKAPKDTFFWKNSNKHFYEEHFKQLRELHPKFFDKTYVDNYVSDNLDQTLEDFISSGEKQGVKFSMLHESYTNPLKKRIIYNKA